MSDLDGIQNCRQFLMLNLPVKISRCFPYSSVGCFSILSQSVKYGLSIHKYEILFLTYAHTVIGKHLRYLGQPTLSSQYCNLRTFTCLSAYPLFSVFTPFKTSVFLERKYEITVLLKHCPSERLLLQFSTSGLQYNKGDFFFFF